MDQRELKVTPKNERERFPFSDGSNEKGPIRLHPFLAKDQIENDITETQPIENGATPTIDIIEKNHLLIVEPE